MNNNKLYYYNICIPPFNQKAALNDLHQTMVLATNLVKLSNKYRERKVAYRLQTVLSASLPIPTPSQFFSNLDPCSQISRF